MVNIVVRDSDIIGYEDEHGNRVIGRPNLRLKASITFQGSNNVVEFGKNSNYWGGITFRRDGNRVSVGESSLLGANFDLGADTTVTFGDRFNMAGILMVAADDGCTVTVGDDSMISQNCALRAYDSHPIFDLTTRERTNFSRDIHIGSDVWIGNDVTVSGGGRIGHGSIIGTRSVVTASRPVGEHCVAVGSPARVVKEKVAWTKPGNPPSSRMDEDAHRDCLARLEAASTPADTQANVDVQVPVLVTPDDAKDMFLLARSMAFVELARGDLREERVRSGDLSAPEVQRLNWALTAMQMRLDELLIDRDPGLRLRSEASGMALAMVDARAAGHPDWDKVGADEYLSRGALTADS